MYPESHHNTVDWRTLVDQKAARTTHLSKIVRHEPTNLGFYNALGLEARGVWLNPSRSGKDLVWCHP